MGESLFKLLIIYLSCLLVIRLSKKRELPKLSLLEFMTYTLELFLFMNAYTKGGNAFFLSLIPPFFLEFIYLLLAYFMQKSKEVNKQFGEQPILLIQDGKLNFKEITKLNYSLDTLFMKLKDEGVHHIEEVNYAVLEPDGTLALFRKEGNDYPFPLILDGIINMSGLHEIGKDTKWLHHVLKLRGVSLKDVFYAFQKNNHVFVIKKQELLQK